jgi:1,4-alpha-glucan branching enzyme
VKKRGSVLLLLHAHLPYVRHPEYDFFYEETWLFEAVIESYLPLLDAFHRLINDGVDFRVTLSLSPTLAEMLGDALLRERFQRHMARLLELAEREVSRTSREALFAPVSRMYEERLKGLMRLYHEGCRRDVVSALGALEDAGCLEIITTSATHAYLPNLAPYPAAVRTQIRAGMENHRKHFGKCPAGLWLPECGYYEGLDGIVSAAGAGYFFLESHGLLFARPRPGHGVFRPARCPSGAVAFARDSESARLVWSAGAGYPGGAYYRDFHRDIGYDLPLDYIGPYMHPGGTRMPTGIKYHRVTGKTGRKRPYLRDRALAAAEADAEDFAFRLGLRAGEIKGGCGFAPLFVLPFDAELFGHWWFEGPEWLEALLRKLESHGVRTVAPSEYLSQGPVLQETDPSPSSWGYEGHGLTWSNCSNDRWLIEVLRACDYMEELSDRTSARKPAGVLKRALDQALRELLLAQSSDWPFLLNTGAAAEYAERRLKGHLEDFWALGQMVERGKADPARIAEIEDRHPAFPEADYRLYGRSLEKGYVRR